MVDFSNINNKTKKIDPIRPKSISQKPKRKTTPKTKIDKNMLENIRFLVKQEKARYRNKKASGVKLIIKQIEDWLDVMEK